METDAIVSLLDEIDTDDAADVLADLRPDVAERVLPRLEDADEIEALLRFEDDTAGGLMETDYVAVHSTATVAEATEELRRCAEEVDPVYVVYVLDTEERLVGLVDLKTLVLARSDAPITSIMDTDFVTVEPDLDQEEVARMMERYDLVTLPVVSGGGRLLGRITIDDIVDVIRDEAEEDLQRASGIAGDEEISASVFAISRGRLPWLLIGLLGAFFSGLVIRSFEGALRSRRRARDVHPHRDGDGGQRGDPELGDRRAGADLGRAVGSGVPCAASARSSLVALINGWPSSSPSASSS